MVSFRCPNTVLFQHEIIWLVFDFETLFDILSWWSMKAIEMFAIDKLALQFDCHRFRNRFQICLLVWSENMCMNAARNNAVAEAGRVDILEWKRTKSALPNGFLCKISYC